MGFPQFNSSFGTLPTVGNVINQVIIHNTTMVLVYHTTYRMVKIMVIIHGNRYIVFGKNHTQMVG